MKTSNVKLQLSILCILLAAFLLFACKATGVDTADTTDDGSSTPPPPTKYTVTIDPNTGDRGHVTSIPDITAGSTAPAPSDADLPTKTDSEIAYWSTAKDDYSHPFKFGETPVNGNITIYPHWRASITAVSNMLNGNWLGYTNGNTKSDTLYKLSASDSLLTSCFEKDQTGEKYDLASNTNSSILSNLNSMPIDTTKAKGDFTVGTTTYSIYGTPPSQATILIKVIPNLGYDIPTCSYGTNSKYILSKYSAPDSLEINMYQFGLYDSSQTIVLKSYSNSELTLTITGSALAGNYRLVKIP